MNQTTLDQFCQVLKQTTDVLKELTHIEQLKADAASQKQHHLMDGFLQDEQALVLKLRGLEQHRVKLTDALGFQGLTFRQILKEADPDAAQQLTPHFTALTEEAKCLTQAKDSADRIIKIRLREMNTILSNEQGIHIPSHFKDTYV